MASAAAAGQRSDATAVVNRVRPPPRAAAVTTTAAARQTAATTSARRWRAAVRTAPAKSASTTKGSQVPAVTNAAYTVRIVGTASVLATTMVLSISGMFEANATPRATSRALTAAMIGLSCT